MKDNALYLEADEDITSAIDKLKKITGDSVQIVVPKRSTLLQSVINQKLLKKAATTSGKKLVLVTNDRVATDLASRVGLAVAPSLGAEAMVVAPRAAAPVLSDDVIEDEAIDDAPAAPRRAEDKSKAPTKPKLATRQLADESVAPAVAEGLADDASDAPIAAKPGKGEKGPKVPNFSKLQKRSLWVALLVVVIVGYFAMMHVITKGSVTLYANGAKSQINASFTVDTAATSSTASSSTLAATSLAEAHNLSTTFTPSGKKNIGTQATGSVTVTNASGVDQPLTAGTRFAAPDGNIFRSTGDVNVPAAHLNASGDKVNGSQTVPVTADQPGDNYNESAGQAYTIPALSNPKITAQGGQMSGGTSKTVNVVTQADVDKATAAAVTADKAAGLKDTKAKASSSQMTLDTSLTVTTANVNSNPGVNGQGDQATLTLTINYALIAVTKSDFTTLAHTLEQHELGASNQIYEDGLSSATITAGTPSGTKTPFTLATTASGGPKVDTAELIGKLKGEKYSDAVDSATATPGIVRADVTLSPAWATSMPSITKHISVTVKINQQ